MYSVPTARANPEVFSTCNSDLLQSYPQQKICLYYKSSIKPPGGFFIQAFWQGARVRNRTIRSNPHNNAQSEKIRKIPHNKEKFTWNFK